jgi:hypothetical protein
MPNKNKGGVKFDAGKPMMSLISSKFLVGLAKALTYGAKKYAKDGKSGAHNWRKGLSISRTYDALQRHLVAWNDGENIDEDSGLPHLYLAACELMFITETMETKPHLDDRYIEEQQ